MTISALGARAPEGMRTTVAGVVAAGVPVFYNLPQAGGLDYGYIWSITFANNIGGLAIDIATGLICIFSPLNGLVCALLAAG